MSEYKRWKPLWRFKPRIHVINWLISFGHFRWIKQQKDRICKTNDKYVSISAYFSVRPYRTVAHKTAGDQEGAWERHSGCVFHCSMLNSPKTARSRCFFSNVCFWLGNNLTHQMWFGYFDDWAAFNTAVLQKVTNFLSENISRNTRLCF